MEYYETLKPVRSKTTKTIISIAITLVAIPILCVVIAVGSFVSVFTPEKDPYASINWVKSHIITQESGKVTLERYAKGDRLVSSYLWIELSGSESYDKVIEKAQSIPNIKCQNLSDLPEHSKMGKNCRTGPVEIQIRPKSASNSAVTEITFIDDSAGRVVPDPKAEGEYKKKR